MVREQFLLQSGKKIIKKAYHIKLTKIASSSILSIFRLFLPKLKSSNFYTEKIVNRNFTKLVFIS